MLFRKNEVKHECENIPVGELVIGVEKPKTRLVDSIKFGFGFYIGFNLARTLKYLILATTGKK